MSIPTSIPKIIHQTWKTDVIPQEWCAFAESWKKFHPDWQYILWTDESARDFVVDNYPELLETYDAYDFNIERADVIRYLVLHNMGGVYADLDMECIASLEEKIDLSSCFLSSEPPEHVEFFKRVNKGHILPISNALMGSVPNHNFWEVVIEKLQSKKQEIDNSELNDDFLVIERTGPGMLTEAVEAYEKLPETDLNILSSHIGNPLTKGSPIFKDLTKNPDKTKKDLVNSGTAAIHYWNTTWWPPKNEVELINPKPQRIKGFKFYQGRKSNDVKLIALNVSRDVAFLAEECLNDSAIVAFDTDGNTMSLVDLPQQWVTKIGANKNEGIYLKSSYQMRWIVYKSGIPYFIAARFGFMNWPAFLRKPLSFFYQHIYKRLFGR